MNNKIKELQAEIEKERYKMSNCNHTFGKSFYDPETYKKGYGSVQDGAGSDVLLAIQMKKNQDGQEFAQNVVLKIMHMIRSQ